MDSRMCLVGANAARPALSADAISSSVRVNRAGVAWRISTGRRRPATGTHAAGNPRANGACGSGHASGMGSSGASLNGWRRNHRRWPHEQTLTGSAGDHGRGYAQCDHHRVIEPRRQHQCGSATVQHAVEHISRMDAAIEHHSPAAATRWDVGGVESTA
jgi:hypothetical protein